MLYCLSHQGNPKTRRWMANEDYLRGRKGVSGPGYSFSAATELGTWAWSWDEWWRQMVVISPRALKTWLMRWDLIPWVMAREICKIKPVTPKGNPSWICIGRTDAEVEGPVIWPPDETSQLIRKDPDTQKDWRQKENGAAEDEMVGWHHWLSGLEFESTGRQWRTEKPGMLQSMQSQRSDVTEQ